MANMLSYINHSTNLNQANINLYTVKQMAKSYCKWILETKIITILQIFLMFPGTALTLDIILNGQVFEMKTT